MAEKLEKFKTNFGNFHDKYYKHLILLPAIVLLISFVHLGFFYQSTGDFMHKDISLTGGTTITVYEKIDLDNLREELSIELESVNVREISDLVTREQLAVIVETTSEPEETRQVLEDYLGYSLTEENSSIEFTGATLSEGFFRQLLIAVLIAFIFMALVVFAIFRTFIPSAAVVISALANIVMTLTLLNILGVQMSTAGIVALLMLIGYSVDTDILLTNRVLKRREYTLNKRFSSAFNTGMTMTLTSLFALTAAFLMVASFSGILAKIFTVLIIGLGFDIFNTWITNVSILKWYAINKEK